jgi:hypothetical protein
MHTRLDRERRHERLACMFTGEQVNGKETDDAGHGGLFFRSDPRHAPALQ